MQAAVDIFVNLLKNAWGIIVSFIVVAVALGIAYRVLGLAGASMLGSRYVVAEAVTAIVTLIALALLAFVGVPRLVELATESVPRNAGISCSNTEDNSPLIQLSDIVAQLIIAIGAVRMLFAFAKGIASAAVGSSGQMAQALIESGGVVLAALLASAVVPIVGVFLGGCHLVPLPNMPFTLPTTTLAIFPTLIIFSTQRRSDE
jgi:hypothetical protein